MKPLFSYVSLGVALQIFAVTGQAVEVMHWERLPLTVPLLVRQERVVFVDRNVRVGVPHAVGGRLRVQSAGGTVYLRAEEPIEPTRLQLQDAVTGELILLDIIAEPTQDGQSQLEPIRIVEQATQHHRLKANNPAESDLDNERSRHTPVPVTLTRYAAQNLYAPLRTVEPLPGVRRVNLPPDLSLDLLLPSLPVGATALAAWRLDEYWVTAIRLINQTEQVVDLDPRVLLGNFATATFQHNHLGPRGTSLDTTVLYLITREHSLAQSLLPSISPVDATLNLPRTKPETTVEVGQ
ncbi:TIGR03749 family integrating conjugative element protein [Pseudomonas bijieensis]